MNEPAAAQPALPLPPAGSGAPWYVKLPTGARPPQGEIVIDKDHVINRQGKDFVLFAGLLNAAHKAGLISIHTNVVQLPSSLNGQCAVVHATVEFPWGSFTGIGDADTENTSRNIQPHRIRMAETRAKARALRDALNIGMVSVEEMLRLPGEQEEAPAKAEPSYDRSTAGSYRTDPDKGNAAPRPVGERKTYGTPLTKPPVQ